MMSYEVINEWVILLIWDICENIGKGLNCKFSNIFVLTGEEGCTISLSEICKLLCQFLEISLHKNTNSVKQITKNYKIEISPS